MAESVIKWHGGKAYLARRIVALMPPHLHYVEPYFGGGSVLFAKDPEGVSEVANDIDLDLTNFWTVLQNRVLFDHFLRMTQATPFSEIEWEAAGEGLNGEHREGSFDSNGGINVVRAAWFFVRCRQSLAGRMDSFAAISRTRVRRGMNEQASAWLSAVEGLPAVHDRLKRVVILCRDAPDVIRRQDGKDTLFYLDPPYLHETRSGTGEYTHEMTADRHRDLLDLLAGVTGKFLLSGYRSELYDTFASDNLWNRVDFDLPNNAAGGAEKRRMTESVWTNFAPPAAKKSS